jgi:hypothetical protein
LCGRAISFPKSSELTSVSTKKSGSSKILSASTTISQVEAQSDQSKTISPSLAA